MENAMSSRPVYESIIFNRKDKSVSGFTFETKEDIAYVEHYVYKQNLSDDKSTETTLYDMFLYKNPGIKKILRYKLHSWGIQTMESIIRKEQELAKALSERKDQLIEVKDKIVQKTEHVV
jgi:hypothetical protein